MSTSDSSNVNQQLEKLTNQAIKEIGTSKGSLQKLWQWISKEKSKEPREEINHDWHVVHTFLERAIGHFKLQETDEDNKIHTLAKIKAYLELAKTERDFAQAWTYVNLADSLLPLVVDEKELGACMVRLRSRDELLIKENAVKSLPVDMWKFFAESLPDDMRKFLEETEVKKPSHKNSMWKFFAKSLLDDMRKFLKGTKVKKPSHKNSNNTINKRRYDVLREQEVRVLLWNSLNRKISLRMSLWRWLGFYLFIGLAFAIIVAELLYRRSYEFCPLIRLVPLIPFPFVAISILGAFGGGISAFIKARKKVVDITSYETIRVHTILRMLLGAAGSFVVFVAVNWLGSENIVKLLNSDIYVFLGVGIAAGFSEKLFVGTLEQIANKLDIIGKTDEDNQSSKP